MNKAMKFKAIISILAISYITPAEAGSQISLQCPGLKMSLQDYTELGAQVDRSRDSGVSDAELRRVESLFLAALDVCAREENWTSKERDAAEQYALMDAAMSSMRMVFALHGLGNIDPLFETIPKLNDDQIMSLAKGDAAASGALDAVISDLKLRKINMDYADAAIQKDLELIFAAAIKKAMWQGAFTS